jgi:putative transposase
MARKPRLEVEGGLYHVITRGNDRMDIFHSPEDHAKFLSILLTQKQKTSFFLYAYCLMTNHLHLLIERQAEKLGKIMQRVLTGYSQWYNRRYKHVGHVFQARHKAILCQSERYTAELVRYIHLNPVRARMVASPEEYPYSSHRAYLGLEESTVTDVDPVLRLFGNTREKATGEYRSYVLAGMQLGHQPQFYESEHDILGSEEFVDDAIHRIGEAERRIFIGNDIRSATTFDSLAMIAAVEKVFGMPREMFCGPDKNSRALMAKEALILTARTAGATTTELSVLTGIDTSSVSRRGDTAKQRSSTDKKLAYAIALVEKEYARRIAETQV